MAPLSGASGFRLVGLGVCALIPLQVGALGLFRSRPPLLGWWVGAGALGPQGWKAPIERSLRAVGAVAMLSEPLLLA